MCLKHMYLIFNQFVCLRTKVGIGGPTVKEHANWIVAYQSPITRAEVQFRSGNRQVMTVSPGINNKYTCAQTTELYNIANSENYMNKHFIWLASDPYVFRSMGTQVMGPEECS